MKHLLCHDNPEMREDPVGYDVPSVEVLCIQRHTNPRMTAFWVAKVRIDRDTERWVWLDDLVRDGAHVIFMR